MKTKPLTRDSTISVGTGKYVDYGWGMEEEFIPWIDWLWSLQPKPAPVPPEAIEPRKPPKKP